MATDRPEEIAAIVEAQVLSDTEAAQYRLDVEEFEEKKEKILALEKIYSTLRRDSPEAFVILSKMKELIMSDDLERMTAGVPDDDFRFSMLVAEGKTQTQAAKEVFPDVKDSGKKGYMQMRKKWVRDLVEQHKENSAAIAGVSKIGNLLFLENIKKQAMEGDTPNYSAAISATVEQNKMLGYNAPVKTENKTEFEVKVKEIEKLSDAELLEKIKE